MCSPTPPSSLLAYTIPKRQTKDEVQRELNKLDFCERMDIKGKFVAMMVDDVTDLAVLLWMYCCVYFLSFNKNALLALTFFCNCNNPYNNPSAVGGQPGT